jgi:hypothetical protein
MGPPKRSLPVAAVLFCLVLPLLVPAAASASTKVSVVSETVPVARGYSLFLVAEGKSLVVFLQRAQQGSTQSYEVSSTHGRVSVGAGLGAGDVSAKLGRYGSVGMHFSSGGGHPVVVPKTCRVVNSGRYVSGELTGALDIRIGTHHFTANHLSARAIRGASTQCTKPPTKFAHGQSLYAYAIGTGTPTVSWARDAKGHLFELARLTLGKMTDPATLFASVYAPAPNSALTVASDLSTAHAQAAGPFLRGSVSFTATAPSTGTGVAAGMVTGTFSVLFDLLGIAQLPDPAQAIASSN